MNEKIRPTHVSRTAYVYIRQSTMHQVRFSRESQRRQYGLAERARQLGFSEVCVIDDDLGRSGSWSQERPGFARLLVAVCESRAGAVFAVEASRLARNNREWHHLVDLCGLTDTLVIDDDGIYDPCLVNDRLLLGLKGTMSEFELSLFRQRAREALRQMVARGEVLTRVPVGYERTPENSCEIVADRQVQDAIRGVFAKFRELGSARQVVLWYRQEQLPLPTRSHASESGIAWQPPTYTRLLAFLKNPIYAGAFVYGRRHTGTVMVGEHVRKRRGLRRPMDQWPVLIRDHHKEYIDWDEFLRNQSVLASNTSMGGMMSTGAAKRGPALLAGLLRCRRCGRTLSVVYSGASGRIPRYECRSSNVARAGDKCIRFAGARIEEAVLGQVLLALRPLAIDASLEAYSQLVAGDDVKRRSLALAVDKTQYEVERARRQYDLVDPANRLVASELEKRWNEGLDELHQAEARLAEQTATVEQPSKHEHERLLELGRDIDSLWNHPETSVVLKKRILRTVLTEIIADVADATPEVFLWLHWAGGVHTQLRVRRRRTGEHRYTTNPQVVELVAELAKVCDDRLIAGVLNRVGLRTGKGNTWTQSHVANLRSDRKIPMFDPTLRLTWITMTEASRALGVSMKWVGRMLRKGILPGRQVLRQTPWVIERTALELPAVRAAVHHILKCHGLPPTAPGQVALPLESTT